MTEVGLPIAIGELTLYQKRIQGALFGQCTPSYDILRQAQMYRDGKLKLDTPVAELVPAWNNDPRKRTITLRQLGSHC